MAPPLTRLWILVVPVCAFIVEFTNGLRHESPVGLNAGSQDGNLYRKPTDQLTGYAPQTPQVWDALRVLRGGHDLTIEDQHQLLTYSVAGQDYPVNALDPDYEVDCTKYSQPGFYAETDAPSKCQVFHRCDFEGRVTRFLCPNKTLFNQITLVCDWFFNVDCSKSSQFVDYTNRRLSTSGEGPALDDQLEYIFQYGFMPPDKPHSQSLGSSDGQSKKLNKKIEPEDRPFSMIERPDRPITGKPSLVVQRIPEIIKFTTRLRIPILFVTKRPLIPLWDDLWDDCGNLRPGQRCIRPQKPVSPLSRMGETAKLFISD